ncbi:hypothetical protein NBRC10512_002716 [Rhodotorula toruloides]|uniref:RHTO0S11e06194g1_1 n=2 Tax=Rhodotorula toruloides TaxID=5286 RepID=A0A061B7M3_RHOTO|nr:uncharacterized protein RHTO_01595 [Rhodotorula toruloides NP11]EMS21535.1 hypothetical protein RHTO_01595 [Rhodotorula toruloides NP11]CDR45905.1 RHTO0S11e06194g1_1 [Rhodotorula toruloides]
MFLHQRGRLTRAQFEEVLSRLSLSGFDKPDLRMAVEPLTEHAKEALFEQLKYLDESVPGHRLPPPMTVLAHAEIGGKYLELVHGVRNKIKSSERFREGALMRDFQQALPFTFFATLPLELMDALTREGTSARAGSYLRNATLLLREAIRSVYSRKTVLLVRLFHLDSSTFEAFTSWAKEFRESVGQRLPQAEEGGKIPLVYWQEVGDVVRADWKALEKAWEWVVEQFCELGRLPGDEELLKLHSHLPGSQRRLLTSHADMHSLSRISLRAARWYGTSQRAWAARMEGRGL